jgi:YgiT-type zinc finger domain-containing protein
MQCVICKHGNTRLGLVTVTWQREDCLVILKQVPAEVCENCGEYYLNESVTEEVLKRAEESINKGAEVEILRYAA